MVKKQIILFLIIILLVLTTGCDTMETRFMPGETEDRIFDITTLEKQPTTANFFTYPDTITIKRGSSVIVPFGFYNNIPGKIYLIAAKNTNVRFGEASEENTLFCKDENSYDYTLLISSPKINLTAQTGAGIKVTITDEHSITASTLTCAIAVHDLETTTKIKVIEDFEINIID